MIVAHCGMIGTSFSLDGAEVGWHPSSAPLTLVSFLSFITSGAVRQLGVLWHNDYLLSMDGVEMKWTRNKLIIAVSSL